jgi:hypothetical protein
MCVIKIKNIHLLQMNNCDSLFQHMCTTEGKTNRCLKCGYVYCDYHFKINNSLFSSGGHVCK